MKTLNIENTELIYLDPHVHTDKKLLKKECFNNGRKVKYWDKDHKNRHGTHPEYLAKQFFKHPFLNSLAVTNHDRVSRDPIRIREILHELKEKSLRDPENIPVKDASVLFGVEISVNHAKAIHHLVVVFRRQFSDLNLPSVPFPGGSLKTFEEFIKEYPVPDVASFWAHPGLNPADPFIQNEIISLVDGIEAANSGMLSSKYLLKNSQESMLISKNNPDKAVVGSSDLHFHPSCLFGTVMTAFSKTYQDFFAAIKNQGTKIIVRETPKNQSVLENWHSIS